MPRLVLINPASKRFGLGNIRSTAWPPLNLPYLAALTPDHYKVEIIDENIEAFRFRPADIVGITAYSSAVNRAYEIAQIYRKQGIPTIMGGIHVSMMPEEAMNYCGGSTGAKSLTESKGRTLRVRFKPLKGSPEQGITCASSSMPYCLLPFASNLMIFTPDLQDKR
jgi:hypothetical protein